jgi:excisionase family DNA binding protein
MTIEQKLLGVKQVAVILNVSRGTIYRLIGTGEIPHSRIGGRKMVSLDTVKNLLTESGVKSDVDSKVSDQHRSEKTARSPRDSTKRDPATRSDPRQALLQAAEALTAAAQAFQV